MGEYRCTKCTYSDAKMRNCACCYDDKMHRQCASALAIKLGYTVVCTTITEQVKQPRQPNKLSYTSITEQNVKAVCLVIEAKMFGSANLVFR